MKKLFFLPCLTAALLTVFIISASAKTKSKHKALSLNTKKAVSRNRSKISAVALAEITKNIEYDFAKVTIRSSYYDNLDKLAKFSIDNNSALVLRGYADSIGTFKGNWVISDLRAHRVKDYLVKKGVPESNIVATAFGNTKPIASNKTSLGRQRNRRVEIKVNAVQN